MFGSAKEAFFRMFGFWSRYIDRYDQSEAAASHERAEFSSYDLGCLTAFPESGIDCDLTFFQAASVAKLKDNHFFGPENVGFEPPQEQGDLLRFSSDFTTELDDNNWVWVKATRSRKSKRALVLFHHWGADKRYKELAAILSFFGFSVFEVTLPYHFERNANDYSITNRFVSPNLGLTIRSMRQGVQDGRKVISWLAHEGYEEISVLGISLGSWVAALVAAHEPLVTRAAFFLGAGNAADVVWDGAATRKIRSKLETHMGRSELRAAWEAINLENYSSKLARNGLDVHFVVAKRDLIVPPSLSERYISKLAFEGAVPSVMRLNCGHSSFSLLPYSLLGAFGLVRFLKKARV